MSYNSDFEIEPRGSGPLGSWEGLHPGVRSAMIMWILLIGVALLNTLTGNTSLLLCYPVQLLLYAGNGYMAGRFALASNYHSSELPNVGAIAGFVAWILPALFYIIFGMILGVVTLGIGFLGVALWCVFAPFDLAIHAALAAVGAWFAGRGVDEMSGGY